jgi:eukaryotic-like serine/threonine-protein kinase
MTILIGGRYEIIEELGRGSCGITFLAHDRHLPNDPIVVVKQLIIQSNRDPATLKKIQEYFEQEGKLLQRIGGKDGIPRLFAYITENDNFYLVQEYIEGSDLSARLISGKSLEEKQTVEILRGILTPLKIVHDHNIIHRDLKPANIRVRRDDGKIFLIDFGVAKQIQSSINPDTWQCGTPGYMPLDRPPILSTDIFAVGIIGIQALTGISPLEPGFPITPSGKIVPNSLNASAKLIEWLNRAIAPNSNNRFIDASKALEALEPYKPPMPTSVDNPQNPKRYIPIILALTACAFAAIAIATVTRKQPPQPTLPPPIQAAKWQTYKNVGIQFDYPPQWEVIPIGSINNVPGNFTGDILEIHPVADTNKSCSERLILNIKNTPTSNYTIDLYRQDTIDRIKDINEGGKLADMTTPDTKFAGQPAYRLSFQRKDRQCKILQSLETGMIDHGKSHYLNYSFIPRDRDENRQQIFDRVVNSFKIQKMNNN